MVHCSELSGEGRRSLVAESGVGTLGAVGLDPIGDGIAGVVDAEEQGSLKSSSRITSNAILACPASCS